jgi:hypothetical protein
VGGLRVGLGRPRQVRESIGHQWFPGIARFPNGDLMLTAILTADTHDNLVNAYCVSTSTDDGATWSPFYDVAGWGGGPIPRVVQADGSLAGPDFYLYPDPPGQARTFFGHFERFADGGRRFQREAFGLRVDGLPRDVKIHGDGGKWSKHWPANFIFYGSYVEVDGEILTCTHLVYEGETRYTQVALASPDRGKTWQYRSTAAPSETAPDGKEGPNESCVIELADGDLMCVMRVGRTVAGPEMLGPHAPMARVYSGDGGRTWSMPDRLPLPGVAPCLRRLSNGVLAISTGRPGLFLWLSEDPRGERWQAIDVLAHHNEVMGPEHQIRPAREGEDPGHPDQTTAYTEFVEIAPNRLLLTYDRVPYGWKPVPTDTDERNRLYVMEIEVDRG